MTKEKLISFFFLALLLVIAYQVFYIFSPFFEPIFWSSVLAFMFYPIYRKLLSFHKNRETPAALLTVVLMILTVVPILAILIAHLVIETAKFYDFFWAYVRDGKFSELMRQLQNSSIAEKIRSHHTIASFIKNNLMEWVLAAMKALGNTVVANATLLTKNIFFFSLNFLLMIFLMFFLLKDGHKIYHFVYEITPLDDSDKGPIFKQITDTFAAVIHGQVLTAIAQALTAGVVFWSLGLPLPILSATATFFCAFIPLLGASIIWGGFVIHLLLLQNFSQALILFALGFFGISMIDNLLKPLLDRKSVV